MIFFRLFSPLLLCIPILLSVSSAMGQSDRDALLGKDGLIIGLGIGGAVASTTTKTTQFGATTETTETKLAVSGDFKFGGGLGERVLLYWFGKTAWYNGSDSFGIATQTSTIIALSGIGSSYWITSKVALSGGVGVTSLTTNRETGYGPGFVVGAEYEFARHWLIDFDVMFGKPNPDEIPGIDRETSSVAAKVTLNWLYY
jgi:hypothetical protein